MGIEGLEELIRMTMLYKDSDTLAKDWLRYLKALANDEIPDWRVLVDIMLEGNDDTASDGL